MGSNRFLHILRDTRVVSVMTILFGFLYIPAFVYGTFWLWVFPFTAIVVLFTRVMIDDAIGRVSQTGDEAVQAKAMIPEFLIMNVKMTVLLSLPFITALLLVDQGQINPVRISEQDRTIWEWCFGVLKSRSKVGMLEIPLMQIVLSNFFFMIVCTVGLFAFAYRKIKQVFVILFHRESYKFLRDHSPVGRVIKLRGIAAFLAFLPLPLFLQMQTYSNLSGLYWCIYASFLIFAQSTHLISMIQENSIQNRSL